MFSFLPMYFTYVFSVSKLILWYLNMSSIDLETQFKIRMYLLNCQPIKDISIRYHKIDGYALHTSTLRRNRFSKKKNAWVRWSPHL